MTKRQTATKDKKGATEVPVRPDDAAKATTRESLDRDFRAQLRRQLIYTLCRPEGLPDENAAAIVKAAIVALEGIGPRNELEHMLAVQMVATTHAAMECLRRAMLKEQTFEGRELNLKYTEKLMALYARQIETLDRHRGKGQQKITVEHVNVHAGGQAIVGNVEPATQPKSTSPASQAMLPDRSGGNMPIMELRASKEAARAKRK